MYNVGFSLFIVNLKKCLLINEVLFCFSELQGFCFLYKVFDYRAISVNDN